MSTSKIQFMMDNETLSLAPNAAIWAFALVPFKFLEGDGDIEIMPPMAAKISRHEYIGSIYFDVNSDTVAWWDARAEIERQIMEDNSIKQLQTARQLAHFIHESLQAAITLNSGDDQIALWSRGSGDFYWIEKLLHWYGMKLPYHYRSPRDSRTIISWAKELGYENPVRDPISQPEHSPIGDCLYQIEDLVEAQQFIREAE